MVSAREAKQAQRGRGPHALSRARRRPVPPEVVPA